MRWAAAVERPAWWLDGLDGGSRFDVNPPVPRNTNCPIRRKPTAGSELAMPRHALIYKARRASPVVVSALSWAPGAFRSGQSPQTAWGKSFLGDCQGLSVQS